MRIAVHPITPSTRKPGKDTIPIMTGSRPRSPRSVRVAAALLLVAALGASTGCSLFVPWSYPVTVEASDPRAEIYVNGEHVGRGRVDVSVPRNKTNRYEARLAGVTHERVIRDELSKLGILDAIGGMVWYVPYLGLLLPGAWEPMEDRVRIEVPATEYARAIGRECRATELSRLTARESAPHRGLPCSRSPRQ